MISVLLLWTTSSTELDELVFSQQGKSDSDTVEDVATQYDKTSNTCFHVYRPRPLGTPKYILSKDEFVAHKGGGDVDDRCRSAVTIVVAHTKVGPRYDPNGGSY